jgi:hypothetical protein
MATPIVCLVLISLPPLIACIFVEDKTKHYVKATCLTDTLFGVLDCRIIMGQSYFNKDLEQLCYLLQ